MALDIGKFLLVGGIGFVAYELFFSGSSTPAAAAPATTPATPAPAASTPSLRAQIATLAGSMTSGNADQWGYYYAEAAGKPATDPGSYLSAANREETFALPAWCSASGLCGIVPMSSGMSGYFPTNRLAVFNEE